VRKFLLGGNAVECHGGLSVGQKSSRKMTEELDKTFCLVKYSSSNAALKLK